MKDEFRVDLVQFGLSDCERLCAKGSSQVYDLASRVGYCHLQIGPFSVPLDAAINMLVHSKAGAAGLGSGSVSLFLPDLRNEVLLSLGSDLSNWSYAGPEEEGRALDAIFFSSRDKVRDRVASLLRCCKHTTAERVIVYSATKIDLVKKIGDPVRDTGSSPLLILDAGALAEQVRQICKGPLFTARQKASTPA